MSPDSIKAMLADPRIDPTSWVGKALLKWISDNTTVCLRDPVARDYLIQGMDIHDSKAIAESVRDIYKESQDPAIIKKFVEGLNSLTARSPAKDYNLKWAMSTISRGFTSIVDANIIDYIVNLHMPEGDDNWHGKLLNYLRPDHVQDLLRNRFPRWTVGGWEGIIDLIPRDKLLTQVKENLWENHFKKQYMDDALPKTAHALLWLVFLRLPETDIIGWFSWLKETDAQFLWRSNSSAEELVSKNWGSESIYFGETVCPCGVVAKSKSGYALHRRKCSNGDINLFIASKLLAANMSGCLVCNKCSKSCKSRPGLALHTKKCKSKLGDSIRYLRGEKVLKESYANTI